MGSVQSSCVRATHSPGLCMCACTHKLQGIVFTAQRSNIYSCKIVPFVRQYIIIPLTHSTFAILPLGQQFCFLVAIVTVIISRITASAFTGKPHRSHTKITIIQGLSYLFIVLIRLICSHSLGKYIHKAANQNHTLGKLQLQESF